MPPLPNPPVEQQAPLPGVPSAKAQSWGTLISIVIIVLMVLVGAFYAWGKRIAEQNPNVIQSSSNQ